MKITKFLVLAALLVAIVLTCVACVGGDTKTTPKKNNNNNNDNVQTPVDECPAGGAHDWVLTKEIKPASCAGNGYGQFECSKCKDTDSAIIPQLEHTFGPEETLDPTCISEGKTYKVCEICAQEEIIGTEPKGSHEWQKNDKGDFSQWHCDICDVTFVRYKETSDDLFAMHFDDCGDEPTTLNSFVPGFVVSENGFGVRQEKVGETDDGKPIYEGNKVLGLGLYDTAIHSSLRIEDTNLVLKDTKYVIQFDLLLTTYPAKGNANSFLALETVDANGKADYAQFLFINEDGYLGIVDDVASNRKIDTKLELNTWYNIAVVVGEQYDDGLGNKYSARVEYDLYVDGKKVTLKDLATGAAIEMGRAYYPTEMLARKTLIRISDGGFGPGVETSTHGELALDNLYIYKGTTVRPVSIPKNTAFPVKMPILESLLG